MSFYRWWLHSVPCWYLSTVFRGGNSLFAPKDYDFISSASPIKLWNCHQPANLSVYIRILLCLNSFLTGCLYVCLPHITTVILLDSDYTDDTFASVHPNLYRMLVAVVITVITSRFRHKTWGPSSLGFVRICSNGFFIDYGDVCKWWEDSGDGRGFICEVAVCLLPSVVPYSAAYRWYTVMAFVFYNVGCFCCHPHLLPK